MKIIKKEERRFNRGKQTTVNNFFIIFFFLLPLMMRTLMISLHFLVSIVLRVPVRQAQIDMHLINVIKNVMMKRKCYSYLCQYGILSNILQNITAHAEARYTQ